jgi:phosphatidylglycerol---prolipoprotein diacylglyceryl transferase
MSQMLPAAQARAAATLTLAAEELVSLRIDDNLRPGRPLHDRSQELAGLCAETARTEGSRRLVRVPSAAARWRVRPVLFHIGGVAVQSYGVSKALAALVAGWLIYRELLRRGARKEPAYQLASRLTLWGAVAGFAGAKLYYLAEHPGSFSIHHIGGTGFTWYGGLIGGAAAVLMIAHRHGLSARLVAGIVSAPLAFAYGIGRLGCFFAGDGTYGKPSDLPWAMSFPHGSVPTTVRVQPTALYEAIAALALGAVLWRLRGRISDTAQFATFAIVIGIGRFLVEFVRINPAVFAGLSQPQLWSLALAAIGLAVAIRLPLARRAALTSASR